MTNINNTSRFEEKQPTDIISNNNSDSTPIKEQYSASDLLAFAGLMLVDARNWILQDDIPKALQMIELAQNELLGVDERLCFVADFLGGQS